MRLIDADTIPYFGEVYGSHDRVTFKGRIDALPTVDAEPVRHGRWLDNELSYAEDRHQAMTCSVCHKYSYRPVGEYCRWCGAKMGEDTAELSL